MSNILDGLSPLVVSIDSVVPARKNPRRGNVDKVARSLAEFGQHKPIVARRETGEILIGNHTWQAAKKLGWTQIAVLWTEDDDTTAMARALADNKASDDSRYDNVELSEYLAEINSVNDELARAAGFASAEIEALLRLTATPEDLGIVVHQPTRVHKNAEPATSAEEGSRSKTNQRAASTTSAKLSQGKARLSQVLAARGMDGQPGREEDDSATFRSGSRSSTDTFISASRSSTKSEAKQNRDSNSGFSNSPQGDISLFVGDCRDVLEDMDSETFDACVTDPGVGTSTDEEGWQHQVPGIGFWEQVLRVLKPGAHMAVFGGRRYYHRLATIIEDSGFEIRDTLCWLYPKGMPMSLDIGQAVDRKTGGKGEQYFRKVGSMSDSERERWHRANEWYGWGTELRPSWEPIILARRPLKASSIADNVIAHGTGAINIDDTRIEGEKRDAISTWIPEDQGDAHGLALTKKQLVTGKTSLGRWPADAILSHSVECDEHSCVKDCPVAMLGEPSRFFWCPKASRTERDLGLPKGANDHKSVKPIAVCEWLLKLILPPGGVVLDPFCGTGSVGLAASRLDASFVGIDRDHHVVNDIAARRLASIR